MTPFYFMRPINSDTPTQYYRFGSDVAVSQNDMFMLIGKSTAPNGSAVTCGNAQLFSRKEGEGEWTLSYTLWPDVPASGIAFGTRVALSADGYVAAVLDYNTLYIFSYANGFWTQSYKLTGGYPTDIVFAQDGTLAVLRQTLTGNEVILYRLANGAWSAVETVVPPSVATVRLVKASAIAISTDAMVLAFSATKSDSFSRVLYIMSKRSGSWVTVSQTEGASDYAKSVDCSDDGSVVVASMGNDGMLRIIESNTTTDLVSYHCAAVMCSRDGSSVMGLGMGEHFSYGKYNGTWVLMRGGNHSWFTTLDQNTNGARLAKGTKYAVYAANDTVAIEAVHTLRLADNADNSSITRLVARLNDGGSPDFANQGDPFAISEDTLTMAVAEYNWSVEPAYSRVQLYRRNIGSDSFELYNTLQNGPADYDFGWQTVINRAGTRLAVSADYWDDPTIGEYCGACFIYDVKSGALLQTILPGSVGSNQYLGSELAMSGDGRTLIIGDITHLHVYDWNGTGYVKFWETVPYGGWPLVGHITPDGTRILIQTGRSPNTFTIYRRSDTSYVVEHTITAGHITAGAVSDDYMTEIIVSYYTGLQIRPHVHRRSGETWSYYGSVSILKQSVVGASIMPDTMVLNGDPGAVLLARDNGDGTYSMLDTVLGADYPWSISTEWSSFVPRPVRNYMSAKSSYMNDSSPSRISVYRIGGPFFTSFVGSTEY